MQLWQATWSPESNAFLIWSEHSTPAESSPGLTEDGDAIHPFAASASELERDLALLEGEADGIRRIRLLLPSDNFGPLASPKLPQDVPGERAIDPKLEMWSLPALSLNPIQAVNLLTSLPSQLPAGLRFDRPFLYWRESIKLLLEFLTRGRILPGIARVQSSWHSRWYVRPQNIHDEERLKALAESMPPICRAFIPEPHAAIVPAAGILDSFFGNCADTLVRSFLARQTLYSPDAPELRSPRYGLEIRWLTSLANRDSTLQGSEYELLKFEQRMRGWSGTTAQTTQPYEFATALTLVTPTGEPPAPDAPAWQLDFSLRSFGEPVRELTAQRLWNGELGFLKDSDCTSEELEQRLLRDLGKAVQFFPELAQALMETHPVGAALTTEQVYRFLRESARLLEQQGYIVVLPRWWSEPQAQFGLTLHLESSEAASDPGVSQGFLAAEELLDYSWRISLGDRELTLEEFRNLVSQKTPLVPVGGQWLELNPRRLQATLKFLEEQHKNPRAKFVDALRAGLGIGHEPDVLPVVGLSASGWIRKLLQAEHHSLPQINEPEGFVGTLRPYQREGLSWLAFLSRIGVGGCLADDMGLGKTIQFLALLLHDRNRALSEGKSIGPTLLIVPMSILSNWEDETRKFAPTLRYYLHHGTVRLTNADFFARVRNSDLVVTTYSLAHRDEKMLSAVAWSRIALDEAQNIKNLEAKQTKAVRRLGRHTLNRQDGDGCRRLALTGTPLENHLEELWSILDFLNPGFLGSVNDFRRRFAVPIERYRNKQASETLGKLIQPFLLRRLKTDPKIIDDLPEKMEMEVFTTLTAEQAALYQNVVDQMLPQVQAAEGMHRKGLVLATITKLKQICNHPVLFLKDGSPLSGRSAKLSRLEEILEEVLAEGDKVLLFTQYAQMGHLLKPYFQERFDVEVLFLHGGLSKRARDSLVQQFRQDDGPPLFILSLKAGGFGLNLTEANQVVHLDQWWNPAVEEQATDRAYRIGQNRRVQVRKFICKGTLEEKIHAMLHYKRSLAEQVVGSSKSVITQLSVEELKQLLELGEAIV